VTGVIGLFALVTLEAPAMFGVEVVIAVTDERGDPAGGETVRVVHRPGLAGEREVAVGITDGRGRVRWTPDAAGVARVRAGDEILPVRVQGPVPPAVPVLIGLLAAGGLLALGLGLSRR
jgi:hypothetical protein